MYNTPYISRLISTSAPASSISLTFNLDHNVHILLMKKVGRSLPDVFEIRAARSNHMNDTENVGIVFFVLVLVLVVVMAVVMSLLVMLTMGMTMAMAMAVTMTMVMIIPRTGRIVEPELGHGVSHNTP
ncbi:hypothetical protein EYZ11_005952 [Aspergillus tanneri]|uniref:Uncharacterized protein n=1 Tax=Aspergillus tanneri TaxID=1220188 RepID=A0A4S3JGQ8_9EURO|nr:hypothetical protein EYZ11_005952 [Aspergillus tanneri]